MAATILTIYFSDLHYLFLSECHYRKIRGVMETDVNKTHLSVAHSITSWMFLQLNFLKIRPLVVECDKPYL